MQKPPPKPKRNIKPLPLPIPPMRILTPPAQKAIKEDFTFDSPTPTRNKTLSEYSALLQIYDEMTEEQRLDFIELGFMYKSLNNDDRKEILDILIAKVFGRSK